MHGEEVPRNRVRHGRSKRQFHDTGGVPQSGGRGGEKALRRLGIPAKLEAHREEDLPFLAQSAYDDACRPGNPKDTSVEDLKELFRRLMGADYLISLN